jgi:hypothetical protein
MLMRWFIISSVSLKILILIFFFLQTAKLVCCSENKLSFWGCLLSKLYLLIPPIIWHGCLPSWLYGSCKYNYQSTHHHLRFEFESCSLRGVLDTTLFDIFCQRLAAGRWFSLVSSTNKTDCHDIHFVTEILLKVVLNTITKKYQHSFNNYTNRGTFVASLVTSYEVP